MDEFGDELIIDLEHALRYPDNQRLLLRNSRWLRNVVNSIPGRRWLFKQACQTENPTQARKARLLIIRILQASGQIWRGGDASPEVYEEALARTQEWFSKNLCKYDPERASFVTWFNRYLGWRIDDVQEEMKQERSRRANSYVIETGEEINPIDGVPRSDGDPWEDKISELLWLIQNDGILCNCRMRNSPDIDCQTLLTQILQALQDSGTFSWEMIAQSHNVSPASLKRFCRTRCMHWFIRHI